VALIPIGLNGLVWVLIIITVIKLIVIAINPKSSVGVTEKIYGNSIVSTIVFAYRNL